METRDQRAKIDPKSLILFMAEIVGQDVLDKIKRQVEFYFSDSNYRKDTFLRAAAESDPDGFIPVSTLLTFNKLKSLTLEAAVVTKALKNSSTVTVSDDGLKIKRTTALPELDTSNIRTVYAKGFPVDDEDVTIESVTELFSKFGEVLMVRLRKYNDSKEFKGSCFIEFKTPEEAAAAVSGSNADGSVTLKFKETLLEKVIPLNTWLEEKKHKRVNTKEKVPVASSESVSITANTSTNPKRKRDSVNGNEGEEEEDLDNKADVTGTTPIASSNEPLYEKGLIVKVSNIPADTTLYQIKDLVKAIGQLKYVEYEMGETTCVVRLANLESVKSFLDALGNGLTIGAASDNKLVGALMEGEEELEYWRKITEKSKKNSGGSDTRDRGRGRGMGRGRGGGRGGGRGSKRAKRE